MSARTRLEFVLLKYFSGSEDVTLEGAGLELERLQASGLVDDFAHELAKKIRETNRANYGRVAAAYGHDYARGWAGGLRRAADLTDRWED